MMTLSTPPTDEDVAREQIEAALQGATSCTACGRQLHIAVRDAEMWLECESLGLKTGVRLALAAGFHDRRRVELPEGVLCAA